MKSQSLSEVHLMPYHRLGKDKYNFSRNTYDLEDLQDMIVTEEGRQIINRTVSILKSYELNVFVGG